MTPEQQKQLLEIARRIPTEHIGNRSCLISRAALEDLQRLLDEIAKAEVPHKVTAADLW